MNKVFIVKEYTDDGQWGHARTRVLSYHSHRQSAEAYSRYYQSQGAGDSDRERHVLIVEKKCISDNTPNNNDSKEKDK